MTETVLRNRTAKKRVAPLLIKEQYMLQWTSRVHSVLHAQQRQRLQHIEHLEYVTKY